MDRVALTLARVIPDVEPHRRLIGTLVGSDRVIVDAKDRQDLLGEIGFTPADPFVEAHWQAGHGFSWRHVLGLRGALQIGEGGEEARHDHRESHRRRPGLAMWHWKTLGPVRRGGLAGVDA